MEERRKSRVGLDDLLRARDAARAGTAPAAISVPRERFRLRLLFKTPHSATPEFDQDWARVRGSATDAKKRTEELELRHERNQCIRELLQKGRSVFYQSTGNSMWPLVQSNDACLFYPIQAVTAEDDPGAEGSIAKEASVIEVGDIVFCKVQPGDTYFAHIVLSIEEGVAGRMGTTYRIGNICEHVNGTCQRQNICGILKDVFAWKAKAWQPRPHPKTVFYQVRDLIAITRWNSHAEALCIPQSWLRPAGSWQAATA